MSPTSRPDRRRGERTAAQRERERAARQGVRGSHGAPQQPRPQTSWPATARQEGRGGFLDSLIIALVVALVVMVVIFLVVFRGSF